MGPTCAAVRAGNEIALHNLDLTVTLASLYGTLNGGGVHVDSP
jgi:hypothetical protein